MLVCLCYGGADLLFIGVLSASSIEIAVNIPFTYLPFGPDKVTTGIKNAKIKWEFPETLSETCLKEKLQSEDAEARKKSPAEIDG
ncbi:MAG: hypothetical protein AB1403_07340 [Candidatus Riflebacteria bacterium]